MARGHGGVDPYDFCSGESMDLTLVVKMGDVFMQGIASGISRDELIDGLYEGGVPSDLIDAVLTELEGQAGKWN
jgi:hypothetical protein